MQMQSSGSANGGYMSNGGYMPNGGYNSYLSGATYTGDPESTWHAGK
jgi:hypothetical protein